ATSARRELGFLQGVRRLPVRACGARLAGVRETVQLEVGRAGRGREVVRFGGSLLETVGRATQLDAKAVRRLDHLRLRAAPSVTPPEQVQGAIRAGRVLEVTDAPLDLFGGEAAVVG